MLILLAILSRKNQAVLVSGFTLCAALLALIYPEGVYWPIHLVVPLTGYSILAAAWPKMRSSIQWPRLGQWTIGVKLLVVAVVLLSTAGLLGWYLLAQPNLSELRGTISGVPGWAILLAGLGFAATNAALEEAIFRGVFQDAFESAAGKTWLAVVLQATLFGVYHYSATSVPDGVIGVVLTFAYGIMLGYLRVAANGLMAPWVAHTIADAVVFALIMGNR